MRRFSIGGPNDRKVVVLEVNGKRLSVVRLDPDGSSRRQEQDLANESAAIAAGDKLARELTSRGYLEHGAAKPASARPAAATASAQAATAKGQAARTAAQPAAVNARAQTQGERAPQKSGVEPDEPNIFEDLEVIEASAEPLVRLAPAANAAPHTAEVSKKKKKKSAKKKGGGQNSDSLDKRVLAAVAAVGLALVGGLGYMLYDAFLKPASIIGAWKGSMVEHEIGRSLSHTSYSLTLDERKNASMSIDGEAAVSGTYSIKGNRILLKLKDEDGDEIEREYKFKVDRATLALIEPDSNKLLVDLVRQFNQPASGGSPKAKAAAAKALVDDGDRKVDPEKDKMLASVEMGAKDGAFRLRHPEGWAAQTGGRPDNTYSYILLDKGASKITIYADVTGALVSGADSANPGDFPEGSEFAPVHKAHEHYAKTGTEDLGGYQEGKPEVFKDSGLGEGRISVFTASAGMFGGKLKGYHATLMTRDRRISVLAYGPEADFAKLRPTYLAVCRSLAR